MISRQIETAERPSGKQPGFSFQSQTLQTRVALTWLSSRKVCIGFYCFFDIFNEKVAFAFLFRCRLSNFFPLGNQLTTEDVNECLNCHGILKEPYIRCCSCLTKAELCVEVSYVLSVCASKSKTHWP